jgi:DNA-binding NarL/FixJ family response regulator
MNQPHQPTTLRAPPDPRWAYLSVALYCPRRLIREALVAWLNRAGFVVVGQVSSIAALSDLCELRHPDVVVVDAGAALPATLAQLAEQRAAMRRTRVVVVHDGADDAALADGQRWGSDALVSSSVGLEAFFLLLHRRTAVPGAGPPGRVADQELSAQEREILTLLGAGHSVRHIATLLDTSPSVVEGGKRRIYAKLRVTSKSQAVARALGLGLVDAPLETVPPAADRDRPPDLTAREFDILRSIALGHTVRQTARLLAIAEKTVENLQGRLFLKLGTHNRAGAIRAAYALGLLDLEAGVPPSPGTLTVTNGAGHGQRAAPRS